MAILITPQNRYIYRDALESVFRLRHRVFNEWLEWDLPHDNGLECDQFDSDQALHFAVLDDNRKAIGTWRIMPTTAPYMTACVFPELFGDEDLPSDPAIWELSRFALDREPFKKDKLKLHSIAAELFVAVFEFSVAYGIAELLSVQNSYITPLANKLMGEPIWHGPTIQAGRTDATCYSYQPSLMHMHALRAEYGFSGPALEEFDVLGMRHAA